MKPLFSTRAAAAIALVILSSVVTGATAVPSSDPAAYPLDTCIVSEERLGEHGDPVVKKYDGREIRFCCAMCVGDFEESSASYLQKLNAEIIRTQGPSYPLDTCVVSNEPLGGAMGDPVDLVVGNRLIRLCCTSCEEDVLASPVKYVEFVDVAVVTSQLDGYPADTCPISGQELGAMGAPFDYVYAGRLVRFCCAGCIGRFEEDPQAALAKIHDGERVPTTAHADDHGGHHH